MSGTISATFGCIELSVDVPANISQAKKRWRMAFAAIFSSRIIASLVKKVVSKKQNEFLDSPSQTVIDVVEVVSRNDSELLDSPSQTTIHVEEVVSRKDSECLDSPSQTVIHVEPDHCFSKIDQTRLAKLVKEKNWYHLQFDGVEGLVIALKTNAKDGIRGDHEDIACRQEVFGNNTYQEPHKKASFHFVAEAFKDPLIVILFVCAALSIGFGIAKDGLEEGCYDGGSILVVILLVTTLSSASNYWPIRQFDKLSQVCNKTQVVVTRNGQLKQISSSEIVVGDVVCLKAGDKVPADGLFLNGHLLLMDESSLTGKNDRVEVNHNLNPFLFAGTYVANGSAQMLVTSVGMSATWNEMMSSISHDLHEWTPLQARLNKLSSAIGKVGLVVPSIVLVVFLIRYFTGNMKDEKGIRLFISGKTKRHDVWKHVVGILATVVAIAAAAVPEGLPLAFAITLAYSMKSMMDNQALVRKFSACEAIAKATTICIHKTGIFTLNQMEVITFWLGGKSVEKGASTLIAPEVIELIHQGIGLNTSPPPSETSSKFSEIQAKEAIISWATQEMGMDLATLKESCTILYAEASNPETRQGGVLMRKKRDGTIHVHRKGIPEAIVAMCSHYHETTGVVKSIDNDTRNKLEQKIQGMAGEGLHCIAFAHKQITDDYYDDEKLLRKINEDSLILLGLVGLRDHHPCRPGVRKSVNDCQCAGVKIKLITKEDVLAARAAATECGILEPNQDSHSGEVVEGEEFQNYTEEERLDKVERICVMARASTLNKFLVVQCLKQKGHVVGVSGDDMGDVLALREADIGLCMGNQGTDVAKESSDIVILDDDFASVVNVLRWGRAMYNHMQIFIQFHLTVSFASLVMDFVTAVSASEPPTINIVAAISAGKVSFAAIQLLWVKLIIGTLAALALTIGQPTQELMKKPPLDQTDPLITNIMWRNTLVQAIFHISVLLNLQFMGEAIFHINKNVKDTLIFNIFVPCQVFNKFNAREPINMNMFQGIHRKKLFLGIIGIIILLQFVMVEFLKRFADTERLNWKQWVGSILIATISWPLGVIAKLIPVPNKPFLSYLKWKN